MTLMDMDTLLLLLARMAGKIKTFDHHHILFLTVESFAFSLVGGRNDGFSRNIPGS